MNVPSERQANAESAGSALRISVVLPSGESDGDWRVDGLGVSGGFLRRTNTRPAPALTRDSILRLRWHDAQGQLIADVDARVREADASGIRIAYAELAPGLLQRLQTPAAPSRVLPAAPPAAERQPLVDAAVAAILEALHSQLLPRCRQLFVHAEQALDQLALDAQEETAGMPARMALERLHAGRLRAIEGFAERMRRPWVAAPANAAAEVRSLSLQLVEDDEMQIWLKRNESARSLERATRAHWLALRPYLQTLASLRTTLVIEALGVDATLEALTEALAGAGLESPLQQFLLRLAGHAEVLDLSGFFDQLQVRLQQLGIAPAARVTRPARADEAGVAKAVPSAVPPADPAHPPAGEMATEPFRGLHRPASPGSVLAATQHLWSLAHPAAPPADSSPALPDAALTQAMRELMLGSAPQDMDEFRDTLQELAAQLAGMPVASVAPRQREAVEMMSRLQHAMESDPLLPGMFRGWSRPLLAPLFAAQLKPAGAGELGDGVRRLFALIEFGSVLCAERNDVQTQEIRAGIDRVIAELAEHPQLDAERVMHAVQQLEALLQRHRRAGSAIEERVVESCIGQQRLVDARAMVGKELGVLFGGREIPQALLAMLQEKLAPQYVLTLVRHGPGSPEWAQMRAQLEALDQALRQAREGHALAQPAAHLHWLRESYTPDLQLAGHFSEQLEELEHCLSGMPTLWVRYRTPVLDSSPDDAGGEGDIGSALQLLQPGEWLAFETPGRERRLLKLAWHAPDRSRFVFVTQLGHKADDLTRAQLRAGLQSGAIQLTGESNANVVDRAWRRMLEGLHDQLADKAIHDALTGLINRKELERRLTIWVQAQERTPIGVLWVGVDRLRALNQSLGHAAGDELLREVALILKAEAVDNGAPLACASRMAGDEFVVILPGGRADEAQARAQAILDQLTRTPLSHAGHPIKASLSIGVAWADETCTSIDSLLRDAERACGAAKESGRGRVYLHQSDDARLRQMRDTVQWVERVERSLQTHALTLYGQRAASLSERARQGPDYLEVLLRMRDESGGVSSPTEFILAAERYGHISAIDRYVLHELTRVLHAARAGLPLRIAFNVSARNIVDPAFIDEIIATLQQQPMALNQLCVELTETAAIAQLAEASAGMKRLSDSGLSMVLDDFGSGWSSYQYLKRLPFDVVKVDGAFIRDIATSAEDYALARSINEIAHLLGKRTVAEHVENQETLDRVREIGFDYAQGYFIAQPAPLADLLR